MGTTIRLRFVTATGDQILEKLKFTISNIISNTIIFHLS